MATRYEPPICPEHGLPWNTIVESMIVHQGIEVNADGVFKEYTGHCEDFAETIEAYDVETTDDPNRKRVWLRCARCQDDQRVDEISFDENEEQAD